MSQFRENLRTEGRTDGWRDGRTDRKMNGRMDRQTLFYRILPAEAGDPKKSPFLFPVQLAISQKTLGISITSMMLTVLTL